MTVLAAGLLVATANAGEQVPVTPAAAASALRGDFNLTLGHSWLDGDAVDSSEADSLLSGGAELQLGMDLTPDYFAQVDLFGEFTDANNNSSYDNGLGLAAHVMRRNDTFGLGLFGGLLRTVQDDDRTDTSERYFGGLEGQLYQANTTYFGQVGYFDGSSGDDDDGLDSVREAGFVRVGVQHFFSETLMLEAELAAAAGEMDSDSDDADILTWGLKLEKQLNDRFSAELGYAGAEYDQGDENDTVTEHIAYVGLTYFFDAGSLKQRNRTSTSLDTPQFLRWSGQTGGPLE
jgi:hypothetical protein